MSENQAFMDPNATKRRDSTGLFQARVADIFKPIPLVAAGAEVTIWTPAAGKKFRLMGFAFSVSAAANITLRDNTAGTTILVIPSMAGNTPTISPVFEEGILSAAANNVLTAQSSAAANLTGFVYGTEE